jgi:hypothetical protein
MVITLWWWYCILIPTLHKRDRFGHYLLDYAIFGAFALSFRYWGTYDVFLVAICTAGFLSKGRLKPITQALQAAQNNPNNTNHEVYAKLLFWIRFLGNYLKFGVTGIAIISILVIEALAITGTVSEEVYKWTAKGQFLMLTLMVLVLLMSWRIWNLAYQQEFTDIREIIDEQDRKAAARRRWWRTGQSPQAPP